MSLPAPQGLYDPRHEHDACGVGFVAELHCSPSHDVVLQGLEILRRLAHRGAAGSDPLTGDGSGILLQLPDAFYRRALGRRGVALPPAGAYAVAQTFLSQDPARAQAQMELLEAAVRFHGQRVLGWRDVPHNPRVLGPLARGTLPTLRQLFIGRGDGGTADAPFERVLFMIRKHAGRDANALGGAHDFYLPSCSSKTVVYKGLMLPQLLDAFYEDLRDWELRSSLALVHSRFSTNTFPTWERAHPYRRLAHNGEINTLRGNQTWMAAREALLETAAFGGYLEDFKPIIRPGGSDSAALDNVVDFLVASGRSLPQVMMMLLPEAWERDPEMPAERRAFYEYHAALIEPWDGPAALMFTDGELIGATLDRNGLRPAKYVVTRSGLVVVASEFGVLPVEAEEITHKGRLQPGRMFLVDTVAGRVVTDEELKAQAAGRNPYAAWVATNKLELEALPEVPSLYSTTPTERLSLQRAFGYSREELRLVLGPMGETGEEPVGSMGVDTPLAVLSTEPQLLFRYFKQQFAQVTNPPIDPIREALVMSLTSWVGGEGNLLAETPSQAHLLELPHPILTTGDLARLLAQPLPDFRATTLPLLFDAAPTAGADALERGVERLCESACEAARGGASLLVLSDRGVSADRAPIPSLLGTSAVHHALIRAGLRLRVGLIVESGEPREVADLALLIGYGAGAVNPYLALETVAELAAAGRLGNVDAATAAERYVQALKKGLLKIMSKMGISCLASYHGAQIFEALGLGEALIARYFPGTTSILSGIGLETIAHETLARHAEAFAAAEAPELQPGGRYAWRREGERHLWQPETVAALQKAVRLEDAPSYEAFARSVNEQGDRPVTLRALWDFAPQLPSVALDAVEPAERIVARFCTGAMSFGSISKEAHETLAVAMNRLGGRSNSGEGGEDPARFVPDARGDSRRSAIKQVASARFGVTTHYLVNATELQIKIAQGAKPGEGGQLPGHKVDAVIARVRHSTPGVTLISPPPHHDIYSIEDLAQLIYDLKCVNPSASIGVKLVAEAGIGTVAAGVAKAHADAIYVAGHDGGTGASPLSSIQHAGGPWELGLAEVQQVLMLNGLRGRVRLQVDGQLRTGRDVAFAALLGAEEFGFATAPLVAAGCVMMRKCHLNTCPVGVATQDPALRARFSGQPEHVIRYFFFVAEELRRVMAELGFRTVDQMVGRTDCIAPRASLPHEKARTLDFRRVLVAPPAGPRRAVEPQDHGLSRVLDHTLLERARPALERGTAVTIDVRVTNQDRAVGAMLSGEVARRRGAEGLPDGTITVRAHGTAGQTFGAFAVRGLRLLLEGEANDGVGKGLSGGLLAVWPPHGSRFAPEENVIVGNAVLYGATAGKAFFSGIAGERFAVRNSGAVAVVEGVGDHGCEYMTGGLVLVLGPTGRNFAAGMSGGLAYVLDEERSLARRANTQMVELGPVTDPEELEELRALIVEHVAYTRSPMGARLLTNWGGVQSALVKVLPVDYKRVLAERKPHLQVVGHG
ncbi:MAG: glutamate synthase large subunit [Deltaproteobacteria bacterium]|nr:glutamate synthase large subunit [Deltaproteobacteria bacterium]